MPTNGLPNPNEEAADTCHPFGVASRDLVPGPAAVVPDFVPNPETKAVVAR